MDKDGEQKLGVDLRVCIEREVHYCEACVYYFQMLMLNYVCFS